jgi:hypothetical protein
VLGTEWSLRAFGKNGNQLWQKQVLGVAWGVNIPRGGKFVIAAYDDGTIRWHRLSDGEQVLARHYSRRGARWHFSNGQWRHLGSDPVVRVAFPFMLQERRESAGSRTDMETLHRSIFLKELKETFPRLRAPINAQYGLLHLESWASSQEIITDMRILRGVGQTNPGAGPRLLETGRT